MDEKRLVEIETSALCGTENGDAKEMSRVCAFDVPELVAEVRRLREQMRLGNTDPSVTLTVGNTQPGWSKDGKYRAFTMYVDA